MRDKVLVFGGTTEGRILSDHLREAGILHEVSVATEYGKEILLESGEENLLVGRKNAGEIEELIDSHGVLVVVDATHPFATAASKEIRTACDSRNIPYLRLKRKTGEKAMDSEMVVYVDSIEEATGELTNIEGNILIHTGSKDLEKIASAFSDTSRLYARVLPNEDSISKCSKAGLSGRQIIAMQGPFSKQMNIATIKETGAAAILTKESGRTGGFDEKIEAATECGIKAVVIRNPENASDNTDAYSLEEVLETLSGMTGTKIDPVKSITLAGMGPGDEAYFTAELKRELEKADIIFGAKAVLKNLKKCDVPLVSEYSGEKIYEYLKENSEYASPVVLFSGDISLCSGAKKATEFFEEKGYKVKRIPGISSVTLFAQRLGLSLENVRIVNAHGKDCDVKRLSSENEETIVLVSGAEHARSIADLFEGSDAKVIVGCDLGCEGERIIDLKDPGSKIEAINGKCLIYINNAAASGRRVMKSLKDDEIIRGDAPMTKEEIRALSMRKLELTADAVFYDVGSGTGSISLEAALSGPDIKVISIEKNEEAIALLERNKEKFGVSNIEIIHGTAPEALDDLPAPSHAFIGGSSGNIEDIIDAVFSKNERTRVVINTVTAETYAQVTEYINGHKDVTADSIQVFISRFKKVGRYHMADAINPVYIITLQKESKDES